MCHNFVLNPVWDKSTLQIPFSMEGRTKNDTPKSRSLSVWDLKAEVASHNILSDENIPEISSAKVTSDLYQ